MEEQFKILNKTLSKGSQHVSGDIALLEAMNYTFQRSNGDGNCFYNSVGMLSSDYVKSKQNFDYYKGREYYTQNMIQFKQQSRVRKELTNFLRNIYNIISNIIGKDDFDKYYDNEIIRYILRNGYRNDFGYVSYISDSVGPAYYGTEVELKLSSLLYKQPIVAIASIRGVIGYEVSHWTDYNIDINGENIDFVEYVNSTRNKSNDTYHVLTFLNTKFYPEVYYHNWQNDMPRFRQFLTDHPQTYFLIGGRGHWSYGINESLLQPSGLTVGLEAKDARGARMPARSNSGIAGSSGMYSTVASGFGSVLGALFGRGGSKGDNKINNIITRKNIKNKTHKKKSHIKVKNKKTKKIVKSNNNNKNNKKTRKNT